MTSSPKRKLSTSVEVDREPIKRVCVLPSTTAIGGNDMVIDPPPVPSGPPDSLIDHQAALAYWSQTAPTVEGVLGGYPQVSRVDIQGSSNFLAKLRRQSRHHPVEKGKLTRAADCGAGIGRVTVGLLSKVAETVDVVEPVAAFTDKVRDEACVGRIYNVGLEDWWPEDRYEVIWHQWCVGQLTDAQLVGYLRRLPAALCEGGWIVVKENISRDGQGADVFDETDSSVTRTDGKFRQLFTEAGLKVVATELQRGMPKELYIVRSYALQPK